MAMTVAITGGSGFIARRLVLQHLERGDTVRVLSRRPLQASGLADAKSLLWYQGDLRQPETLQRFVDQADLVYHCAGEIRDTHLMRAVNITGTEHLLTAATGRIGRWVQLSSVGAYGPYRSGIVTESSPLHPQGEYEISKVQSDLLVEAAANQGAFAYVILRPSIVYGPDMSNQSLFSLIALINKGWFFFIGPAGASANYVHVDNVVKALLLCGTSAQAQGQTYNLSDYRTLEQFVDIITHTLGFQRRLPRLPEWPVRALVEVLGRFPGMPLTNSRVDALTNRTVYDYSKIVRELTYSHALSMEAGLTQLVTDWRAKRITQ